jgi:hypothetical protein
MHWFYDADPSVIGAGLSAVLLFCALIGAWVGHYEHLKPGDEADQKSHLSNVLGAMLGLLALLLGFTFALAAGRFETRQKLIVREANAIGTAILRAEMLPAPYNKDLTENLREYTNLCVTFGREADSGKLESRYSELHRIMWNRANECQRTNPEMVPTGIFITAMNDLIDLHGERTANRKNRVPPTVYVLLFFAAGLGHVMLGLSSGLHGRRMDMSTILTTVLVSGVVYTILDLDRPLSGLLVNDQSPINELARSLNK